MDTSYRSLLESSDPDYIADNLILLLNKVLDNQQNIKIFKLKNKFGNDVVLSRQTREAIKIKNAQYKITKNYKTVENVRILKHMKLQTRGMIQRDSFINNCHKFKSAKNDSNKLWKLAKEKCFSSFDPPPH